MGLKYKIQNSFLVDIFYKNDKVRFYFAMCSKNNAVAHIITKYKHMTNDFLRRHNIPVFPQKKFKQAVFKDVINYCKEIKFPVVVKPVGSLCGKGITVDVKNAAQLKKAVIQAEKIDKNIIIEKFYSGWDHRILIAGGKLLAVTKRFPAMVVGDGHSSVKKLIANKNRKLPKPINIDEEVQDRLKKEKVTLKSVLPAGRILYLRLRANAALGGTTENLDISKVHPDNIQICMKAAKLLHLELAGLDLMSTDISKSYRETGAGITEINDNPATDIHQTATVNPINNIAEQVLRNLFRIK